MQGEAKRPLGRRWTVCLVAAAAAILVGVACMSLFAGGRQAQSMESLGGPRSIRTQPRGEEAGQAALLLERFGLFNSLPEPPSVDGRSVLAKVAPQVDWDLAQLLEAAPRAVWAGVESDGMCLASLESEGARHVCSKTKRLLKHGLFLTFLGGRTGAGIARRQIVGIVPDGVRNVRVISQGAEPVLLPVDGNVFILNDQWPEPPMAVILLR